MSDATKPAPDFGGLEVVAFESRMAKEMEELIARFGGVPRVAPAMREVPLEENPAAFHFVERLLAGEIDAIIFMTGVGTRTLFSILETRHSRKELAKHLSEIAVVARGPKPVKVLREYEIPITVIIPEPNTWREILRELDQKPHALKVRGSRIAIQEYGMTNSALTSELKDRGAEVMLVPVYRWKLPEDIGPLEGAIESILIARSRVILFTNAAQVDHLLMVVEQNNARLQLLAALAQCVVCSVGPTCSEALRAHGIQVDIEPEHPKMGALVHEAAHRAADLIRQKKNSKAAPIVAPSGVSVPPETASARQPRNVNQQSSVDNQQSAMQAPWADSPFMKACRREPTDFTPAWLMRQAGRYMKEYRDLRAKVPFLDLCRNPDLVTEVTVTAAEKLGTDAAIIFADLLLIAEPMGFELEYERGDGPAITPVVRGAGEIERLREVEPKESLDYLLRAIRQTRAALPAQTPLIGFAGAPFTLASYLIEGGASRSFLATKRMMYGDPGAWRTLMEHLARNLIHYANAQIEAGVQAIQVFDTWIGCLAPADYREHVLLYSRMMLSGITPGVPVIHFGTGTAGLLEAMREAGGSVIGLDSRVDLDEAWRRLGAGVGVQGNLDPTILLTDQPCIRKHAQRILNQAAGRAGHIFNLGHGVLPETPYENVKALVEMVHEMSRR